MTSGETLKVHVFQLLVQGHELDHLAQSGLVCGFLFHQTKLFFLDFSGSNIEEVDSCEEAIEAWGI